MKANKEDCDHLLHRFILLAALFVLLLVFVDHVAFAQTSSSVYPAPVAAPAIIKAA